MQQAYPAIDGARPPRRRALERYRDGAKRRLDIVLVLVLAPLVLPVVAVLWLAVRAGGGPGFFGHERVGLDGRRFRCWKLRTMVPDAEARLRAHLRRDRAAAREWAETYKLRHDPRVTRLGRVLRKTSLDELPQLWNVLRGEMSLVGPRPVPEAELIEYAGYEWAYLSCRPGLTGLWQISGRNAVSYGQRVRFDVEYLLRAGLAEDLRILALTPREVLRRSGV
jgi:exopolysaccharide production protein ExoY